MHYILSIDYNDRIILSENDDNLKTLPKPSERLIEKKILRDTFKEYLPNNILYRQKEAFSQGVGHDWMNLIKIKCNRLGKSEDEYYKELYKKNNYNLKNIPYKWLPNQEWINTNGESSATVLSVYK